MAGGRIRATRARESEFDLYAWHLITTRGTITFPAIERLTWPYHLRELVDLGRVTLSDLVFDSPEEEQLFRREFELDDATDE